MVVKRVISLVRPVPEYAGRVIQSGERDFLDKVQSRMIKMIHGIRPSAADLARPILYHICLLS